MKLRRFVVGMLVGVMSMSIFAGCSNKEEVSQKEPVEQEAAAKAEGEESQEKELEPVKLKWYVRWTDQKNPQPMYDAFNELTKEHINAEVELKRIDPGEFNQKMQTVIASGEEFDLCLTGNWLNDYYSNSQKGAFLDITELLPQYAPKTMEQVPSQFWDAAKIDGKLYGVLNYQICARAYGVTSQTRFLDKYNFDLTTVKKLEDIEPLIKAVAEGEGGGVIPFGNLAGGSFQDMQTYMQFDQIGGNNTPGVLIIDGEEPYKVVNQYATEQFKEFLYLMRDWYNKGYIPKDAATITNGRDLMAAKKMGPSTTNIKPGCEVEQAALNGGENMAIVQLVEPFANTQSVTSTLTAISRTSKNPERAMMLLELVNTDKDVYNTLVFGKEGVHYNKVGENRIEPIEDGGFFPNTAWSLGNQFNAYLLPGQEDDVWEQTKELNENAKTSVAMGFAFNQEPVKNQVAQCTSVLEEMLVALTTGSVDPDKYLPTFLEKLETAGASQIIEEKQKQLDEWVAAQGK